MFKRIIPTICMIIILITSSYSSDLPEKYSVLTNAYNSIRLPGKIAWQSRFIYGKKDSGGTYLADIDKDGTINYSSRIRIRDNDEYSEYDSIAFDGEYLYAGQVENAIINIYDPSREYDGGDPFIGKYLFKYSGSQFIAHGLTVMNTPKGKVFVRPEVIINTRDTYLVSYLLDENTNELNEISRKEDGILNEDKKGAIPGTDYKMRTIPGTNYIATFRFATLTAGIEHNAINIKLYQMNEDGKLTAESSTTMDLGSKYDYQDPTNIEISDILYDQYNAHPGFIIYTNKYRYRSDGRDESFEGKNAYFMEMYARDESGLNLILSGHAEEATDILVDLLGNDKAKDNHPLRILYTYAQDIDSDNYQTHIKSVTQLWNGRAGYYSDFTTTNNIRDKDNEYTLNDSDTEFSSLRFRPYAVIFGVPPRYDDGKAFELASVFKFGVDSSEGQVNESTYSTVGTFNTGEKAFGISIGATYETSNSDINNNKQTTSTSSEISLSNKSYGKESAWILGDSLSYLNDVSNFIVFSAQNNKQLEVKDLNSGIYVKYPALNLRLNQTKDKPETSNISFTLSNPSNILDTFLGSSSWSKLTTGLPQFPDSEDIQDYIKDNQAIDWATQADNDNHEYYTVERVLINTNAAQSETYSINNANEVTRSSSKSVSASIQVRSTGAKHESKWMTSVKNQISKDVKWSFDYSPIEYSKIDKDRFSVYAYVFLPTKNATAKDLPWSSDIMKKNNMVTFAVAYNVKAGLGILPHKVKQ